MVYEFVLKLFGRSAVELISLLPFVLSQQDDQFNVEVQVSEPCTKEIVRLVESKYPLTLQCDLSVVINDKYLFRQSRELVYTYDTTWNRNGLPIVSPPNVESFRFAFNGFNFDPNDRIELFSVVKIENDTLFEQSTGFKSEVLWNYYTPTREDTYHFLNGAFTNVDN